MAMKLRGMRHHAGRLDRVADAVGSGARAAGYRNKSADAAAVCGCAHSRSCAVSTAPLIVNDDIEPRAAVDAAACTPRRRGPCRSARTPAGAAPRSVVLRPAGPRAPRRRRGRGLRRLRIGFPLAHQARRGARAARAVRARPGRAQGCDRRHHARERAAGGCGGRGLPRGDHGPFRCARRRRPRAAIR
jgi:hypothetical protein